MLQKKGRISMNTIDVDSIRNVKSLQKDVSQKEWNARIDLAACYRLIRANGWNMGIFNHLSIRVPEEPNFFLIKAHALLWDEVTASNLIKVNLHGELDEKSLVNRPGFVLHSAILRARPDINAIIHIHEASSVAISATKEGLLPMTQDSIFLYEQIGYHDYQGITEDAQERKSIVKSLGTNSVMLMRNHGSVTVGKTMREAFILTERLVKGSKIQLQLMASGAELSIPSSKICRHTVQQYKAHNEGRGLDDWPAALRELDRLDDSYRK